MTRAKAIQTTAKSKITTARQDRATEGRDRGGEASFDGGTHFAPRRTIPLLIIQSNFGEALRVEAGLSSFTRRESIEEGGSYRDKNHTHTFTQPGELFIRGAEDFRAKS